ncbi:MAG: zinc ribbon domain-containing protein [Deltaproteobacteria bacterium]|nr:zinc ribbon domain-containing protein [Kofleriaceae bacterium]
MDKAREESLGHYEMLWDCSHCEAKKLLGKTHRHCPNCGAPQDETKRYFPSDADKVKVEDHVYTGGDRRCGSCGTAQSAKAKNCGQCGAPLGDAKDVARVTIPKPAKKKSNLLWYILFGVVVFGVLVWFLCIRKQEVAMTVTAHRWAAVQEIEEYREVGEEAWKNEVPTGARQLSCARKQRSTKEVPDGEDCKVVKRDKGDGTFEEVNQCTPRTKREGVDDDWCSYRIDRWTKAEELKANGQGVEVAWPAVPPSQVQTGVGARRAGKKVGVFTLELNDGKNVRTCDVSEGTWKKYKDGQEIKAKVRAQSGSIVCSEL